MTQATLSARHNSTNVRMLHAHRHVLRAGFRTFGTLMPDTAASWFERALLTPQRAAVPYDATTSLLSGKLSKIPYGNGWLDVWSHGDGPTVLLLHGWGAQAAHLDAFIGPLVDAGFKVVAFDAPGHGAAAGKMTNLVECTGAALQVARSTGPVFGVVAHSFGTTVAASAARHELGITRMVFLAPPASINRQSHDIGKLLGLPSKVLRKVQQRVERRLGIKWQDFDTDRLVAELDIPLLVIHDRDDRRVSWSDGQAVAQAARQGTMITTSGLGHRGVLRDEKVLSETVRFLSELDFFASHPNSALSPTVFISSHLNSALLPTVCYRPLSPAP